MGRIEDFGSTRDIAITVLVENSADLLARSSETVKRFTKKPLLAEHGFAALVDLKEAGVRILWDAGMTKTVLLENARRMEIDLSKVDKIALSHGHGDHYASMTRVIHSVRKRLEIAAASKPRRDARRSLLLPTMHQSSLGSLILIMPFRLDPLWYTPLLPELFFISAICLGLMVVIFESTITSWLYERKPETEMLSGLGRLAAIGLSIYMAVRLIDLGRQDKLGLIFDGSGASTLFLIEMGLPLLLKPEPTV